MTDSKVSPETDPRIPRDDWCTIDGRPDREIRDGHVVGDILVERFTPERA